MTEKTLGELAATIEITEEQQAQYDDLFKLYKPSSGVSYIDRPLDLTPEEIRKIEEGLRSKG
ncbi:hypothetical protein [Terasakiella pusilla]|uniref:hypothetical protein n=1 Tax=Terasakiella pusilla TaxID=64973 RepID=UPI003AA97215